MWLKILTVHFAGSGAFR